MKEKSSCIRNNKVFAFALGFLVVLVAMGILIPHPFGKVTKNLTANITKDFGWLYLLPVTGILFYSILFVIPMP